MQRRQLTSTASCLRHGIYLTLFGPFASGLAAEPIRTDLPGRTGDAQAIMEEPPVGGAAISAGPADTDTGVLRYPANFFAEFQPTTALDMVKRLPGFSFNAGDVTVRGFVGALGNVLIDGQRPASKSVLLEDVLRRIPFANVATIEVIRGGAPGINMQGQPVVANVVRVGGDMSTHSSELTGMFAEKHDPSVGLRLETTRNMGRLSLNGALNARNEQQYGNSGSGALIRRGPDRELLEASNFDTDWRQEQLQLSGSADYQTDVGLWRINLGGTTQDTKQRDILSPRAGAPLTLDGSVITNVSLDQGEAGVDYEHLFSGDVTGRVLLLQSIEKKIIAADATNAQSVQYSNDEALKGESILRSSVTYRRSPELTFEGGLEGAYNFLDVEANLVRNGVAVALPTSDVKIEEKRGEAFVEARWKVSPRLSSDIGFRYELSTISQSGDNDARRSLSYPKPRALLTFSIDDGLQLRSRIERTVSQLEFRDFASQASLDAGTISSGNADLHPESAWEFEAAIEKRFWGRGAVVLGYTHAMVSDVVDLVPVEGFDTAGNLGDGTRDKISFSLSLPLERIGIEYASLRVNGAWTWSEVDDPVTNEARRISRHSPVSGDVAITKEFPSLSSTLSLENSSSKRDTSYRFAEVRTDHWDHFMRLYWDWTPKADTVVRLMFNNFTGRPRSRWRTVYEGSRASGLIAYHEDRHIDALRFVQLQLRKSF
ncbi:TonB-dependent receptor plug domain-containing protein [Povalibacter sp.]|uniref:TonB-dependent receptor plug domain-containing protein n=1 Tax=Povalibacter sp. TaxID=1962978 RepID=UPI002F3EE420